jgi:APA family basic amino acid/polyamine antiporter
MEEDWGGRATDIVALIALASTVNTTLLVMTAASRLVYSIAREGYFPPAFARLGGPGDAPQLAGLAVFAVASVFAAVADIAFVASVTDFVVFVTFLVVNAAVVRLRFSRPDAARTMRVPLVVARVPAIAVAAFVLAAAMMTSLQASAWALGLLVLAAGALAWFVKAGRVAGADYPEAASDAG